MTQEGIDFAKQFFSGAGIFVLIIAGIIAIISLFADRFNAIYSVLLAIGSFFVTHEINSFVKAGVSIEDFTDNVVDTGAIAFGIMVTVWIFFRYLPFVAAGFSQVETKTYLILGTLIEESDGGAGAGGLALFMTAIVSGGLGIGVYFLMNFALCHSLFFIGYIISSILTIWGISAVVKSFIDSY